MKKLALALVCLVSVAFFASCVPDPVEHPEPSIAICVGENFLYDGAVIDVNTVYNIGFLAASNAQTQKELYRFKLVTNPNTEIEDVMIDTIISGKEFHYEAEVSFPWVRDEIIGSSKFVATVTDVDGQVNSAEISVSLNNPGEPLTATEMIWTRRGANLQGTTEAEMAAVGLQWVARDAFHANIRPLDGCKLFVFEDNKVLFEQMYNTVQLSAFFNDLIETQAPVDEYRHISVATAGEKEYNDVLGIIDAEGKLHLVLIAKANVETGSFGVQTTITGQIK